jgi:hypothetical protein
MYFLFFTIITSVPIPIHNSFLHMLIAVPAASKQQANDEPNAEKEE